MPPNQDSSSVRKRAPAESVDARQSKARRVAPESSADSLLNDGVDNDGAVIFSPHFTFTNPPRFSKGFVFVGTQEPAGFGSAPLLGQSLFLPGTDDEVTTVDPALLGHADVNPSNNSQPSVSSAAGSSAITASDEITTVDPALLGHADVNPTNNSQQSVSAAAVYSATPVSLAPEGRDSIIAPAIAPANLDPTATANAPPAVSPTAAAIAPPAAANTDNAVPQLAPAVDLAVAPAATAVAGNANVLPPAVDLAVAPAATTVANSAIVLPLAPASVAVTVPVTSRPLSVSLISAALVGLGSTRLEHCNDVLIGRVTGIHRWKEEDRFRFPLWDVPLDANWGPPLPFDKPDELLCAANTASALKFHFVAELSRYVLADRDGGALDQVSVNVVPMAARVRTAAETQVQQLSTPSTTVPISYWGPGQIRARTWTSTYGKAPNPFTNIFDARVSFRPYGGMDRLQVGDLGARDIVVIECQIRRYKIDKKKEETGWHKWITYHDLLSISLLQKAPAALTDGPAEMHGVAM
ncbi:hypothetical protein R3P38DRAFT_3191223 [Favolaschia claudopus]|uniref:Uncharacterized protein n=1 Tax=Favolaschia claudopus TaxID=2862362 RepID=A0AAW0BLB9_9AGAR